MTKALQEKQTGILNLLTNNRKAVASVIPKHVKVERLLRVAFMAMSRNPRLLECTGSSIVNALIEASVLGLEIGTPLGHAYLVPFRNNKKGGILEATCIPGYLGYIQLAHQSGGIESIPFHPVYEGDIFDYEYGLNAFLTHKPDPQRKPTAKLIFAYAVVKFKGGGFDFEVVTPADAAETKKRSPGIKRSDSLWRGKDEPAMWCKTAVRKLAKRIPKSPELQRAAMIETAMLSGVNLIPEHLQGEPETDLSNMGDGIITIDTKKKTEPDPPKTTTEKPEPGKKAAKQEGTVAAPKAVKDLMMTAGSQNLGNQTEELFYGFSIDLNKMNYTDAMLTKADWKLIENALQALVDVEKGSGNEHTGEEL